MIVAAPAILLALAAVAAFGLRKRLADVTWLCLGALLAAVVLVSVTPADTTGRLFDLDLRATGLGKLAGLVLLAIVGMLVVDVAVDEPAYNFFPTALAVASVTLAVLVVTSPVVIFALILTGSLFPIGSFTFQVHRNRSVEAAVRHFAFVVLGGSLGLGANATNRSTTRSTSVLAG